MLHLVAFVLAQQAVVHENARQLTAHRPLQQRGGHGAVHAAGQSQQHAAIADLLPALGHRLLQIGRHGPLRLEAADLIQEILQDLPAILGVHHLRMELHAVEPLLPALDRRVAAALGGGNDLEPGSQTIHLYPVAHPVHRRFRHAVKQRGIRMGQLRLAIFPGIGLAALAAQQVHHQLQTVADAQHRHAHRQHLRVDHGSTLVEHRGRAAGENDGVRGKGPDLIHGHAEGLDLAVYAALTDAASHQQVVLAAEIQH